MKAKTFLQTFFLVKCVSRKTASGVHTIGEILNRWNFFGPFTPIIRNNSIVYFTVGRG